MRQQVIFSIVQGAAAMFVGYGVIVLLTSLGFNGGLGGGYTAGLIGPGRGLFNASLVLVPLIGDTIFVLFFFKRSTAPFWFEALAGATLMVCTVGGGFFREQWRRRETRA